MKALILVDIQNDFLPEGALPVKEADMIIPMINELVSYPFDIIVATKDWHPSNHESFATTHGKKIGEHTKVGGVDQILWPTHCVQGSVGSNFAAGWDVTKVSHVIYKGTDPHIDSYSTFYDNCHLKSTGLESYLRLHSIKELFIAGLAIDYCVKYTVLDSLELGFIPYVIVDACRGVNINPGDTTDALDTMVKAGANLVYFKDLKDLLGALNKQAT